MRILLAFLAVVIIAKAHAQAPITNYEFTFKVNNLSDTTDSVVYMANYYGGKQYYFDTAVFEKGSVTFKGDTVKGGIYSIILSDKKSYFEFVVNEPRVSMECTSGEFVKTMKVSESNENKKFYEYLQYIEGKAKAADVLKKELEAAAEGDKKPIEEKLSVLDKEVIAYKLQFIEANPSLFISKVFRASAEPEVPKFEDITDPEKLQRAKYFHFKRHYLDGVDFTDERLLRTPVLNTKLTYYITKLVAQMPDSIIKEADRLIELSRPSKEVFKFVVHTITSKYEDSKIMGLDAVLVHMGQNYYCNGQAYWLSGKKLEEFCERVEHMAPLLIGNPAIDLILPDTAGKWHRLYDITAPYTVLYFWASDCGHCKKVTPKLKEFYDLYHAKGVEVYAVETTLDDKEWKQYLRKHDMPWINVSDNPDANKNAQELILNGTTTLKSLNFRDTYDIYSTPKIFLLDQNKKIIASKLMPEQLGEFIDRKIEEELKKKAETAN